MKVNELLHSLVLQGHKLPLNLHPPLQAEYYSKSKKNINQLVKWICFIL